MSTPSPQAASRTVSTPACQRSAGWRALVGAVAALGLSLAAAPVPASAASCKTLLQNFAAYSADSSTFIVFQHTTNYQAHGFWATAHSWGSLDRATSGPILTGMMHRFWDNNGTEDMLIEFYADGSVRFGGQYGPYPTQCYGDKFLTVNTWDSFETFTFEKGALF